jgi:hypothetical protein
LSGCGGSLKNRYNPTSDGIKGRVKSVLLFFLSNNHADISLTPFTKLDSVIKLPVDRYQGSIGQLNFIKNSIEILVLT